MNKSHYNILEDYKDYMKEQPEPHVAEMLTSLQAVIDRAYQDGYEAATLHLEKEYKNHE